jgi:hypothetical protein
MAKVTHVTMPDRHPCQWGASIEKIDDQDRIALTRFFYYFKGAQKNRYPEKGPLRGGRLSPWRKHVS